MLNSIRNIKFIEMRKLTMFITAVCGLFLSFFVSLVNYFAVTCYVNTATDWKILERFPPPPQKKRRKYMYKRVIFRKWKIKWYWFSTSSNVPLSWRPENSTTRNKGGIPQVAQTELWVDDAWPMCWTHRCRVTGELFVTLVIVNFLQLIPWTAFALL